MISSNPAFAGEPDPAAKQLRGMRKRIHQHGICSLALLLPTRSPTSNKPTIAYDEIEACFAAFVI
jgi:hypothetical protein